jgi:hypothetical protein
VSERKRFPLRLDPRLYDVLERWAADELRSVNAQIELLLRDQARHAGRLPGQPERGSPGGDGGDHGAHRG